MVVLLPAIHAAREAARKNASGKGAATSSNNGRGVSPNVTTVNPNLTALDTSTLSPEARKFFEGSQNIGFANDSLADTAFWAKTRLSQLHAAIQSGNQLVANEVRDAVVAEVKRLVGAKVRWELTVAHVQEKDIVFYPYITDEFRIYQRTNKAGHSYEEDPQMPIGPNLERARKLTQASKVLVSADLTNLELILGESGLFSATLANLRFADVQTQ